MRNMLRVRQQHTAYMDQLFQHRHRIMFRYAVMGLAVVLQRSGRSRTFVVIDGLHAIGIINAINRQYPVGSAVYYTPPP